MAAATLVFLQAPNVGYTPVLGSGFSLMFTSALLVLDISNFWGTLSSFLRTHQTSRLNFQTVERKTGFIAAEILAPTLTGESSGIELLSGFFLNRVTSQAAFPQGRGTDFRWSRVEASQTANLRTKIMDLRVFDTSRILILRGGILMSIRNFPESLSQGISRDNLSREIGRISHVWRCPVSSIPKSASGVLGVRTQSSEGY